MLGSKERLDVNKRSFPYHAISLNQNLLLSFWLFLFFSFFLSLSHLVQIPLHFIFLVMKKLNSLWSWMVTVSKTGQQRVLSLANSFLYLCFVFYLFYL